MICVYDVWGAGLGELETVLSYEDSLDKKSKKNSLTQMAKTGDRKKIGE